MNNEEQWLKTKIESTVEQNASNRLAEVKQKAVQAENVYYEEPAKKRSILKTSLTAVSCVIVAAAVAALAASPFIYRTPRTENPGDTTASGTKDEIQFKDTGSYDESSSNQRGNYPVEESFPDDLPTEPTDYYNPICFQLDSICGISLADESIEDIHIYVCDFPSGEIYKGLSVYREGKALAVEIGKSNGMFETVYFWTDSEYYLKNLLGEDYSVQISSPAVNEITREIEFISQLMRTSPLVVCKSSASDETEFSSVEEILEYVGCVIGDMKAEELKFYFECEDTEMPHLGVSLGDSVKKEYCTYEFACNSGYDDVKSRFEKYREDAWNGATVFYVPASALTQDDIDFIADCIVPNMSGMQRNEAEDFYWFLSESLGCPGKRLENISTKEENGKYYLEVSFSDQIIEFLNPYRVCSDRRWEISENNYNELNEIIASSDDAKTVDFDIYFSVCSAVETAYSCEDLLGIKNYNDTITASKLRNILCGANEPFFQGISAVVGAEWSSEEPSLLRLKIRYTYGTLADAYIKYDFDKERDSIFFDNTSELDNESIEFINMFIEGADEILIMPCVPDLSSCNDAKEGISLLFHYLFQNTAEIDVNFVSLLKLEKGEFFAAVGSESGMVYWLCIGEESFGILAEKYGCDQNINIIDSLTLEDVMLISRSYASLKSVPYELNSPVSPIPLPNYDPLTDAVNAITGKEYIEVESIDMFEIEYDMFFRIDVLDAEGGVTSYYVCGVGNDLFMACASGDDGVIADALMGCELRTYDECEEILNQIRPTEEDGVFAFDTFSFANDSELYKAGDPGVKTEGFVNTRPSGSDLPVSVLLEKAKAECTVEYDTVRIQFDPRSYVFSIDFYVKDVLGGDESVYIDLAGRTKLIVYGE